MVDEERAAKDGKCIGKHRPNEPNRPSQTHSRAVYCKQGGDALWTSLRLAGLDIDRMSENHQNNSFIWTAVRPRQNDREAHDAVAAMRLSNNARM